MSIECTLFIVDSWDPAAGMACVRTELAVPRRGGAGRAILEDLEAIPLPDGVELYHSSTVTSSETTVVEDHMSYLVSCRRAGDLLHTVLEAEQRGPDRYGRPWEPSAVASFLACLPSDFLVVVYFH